MQETPTHGRQRRQVSEIHGIDAVYERADEEEVENSDLSHYAQAHLGLVLFLSTHCTYFTIVE